MSSTAWQLWYVLGLNFWQLQFILTTWDKQLWAWVGLGPSLCRSETCGKCDSAAAAGHDTWWAGHIASLSQKGGIQKTKSAIVCPFHKPGEWVVGGAVIREVCPKDYCTFCFLNTTQIDTPTWGKLKHECCRHSCGYLHHNHVLFW